MKPWESWPEDKPRSYKTPHWYWGTDTRYTIPLTPRGKRGGNWCGWGWTQGGAPIDSVDQACRRHDIRYMKADELVTRYGPVMQNTAYYQRAASDLSLGWELLWLLERGEVAETDWPAVLDMMFAITNDGYRANLFLAGDSLNAYYFDQSLFEIEAYLVPILPWPREPEDAPAVREQMWTDLKDGGYSRALSEGRRG